MKLLNVTDVAAAYPGYLPALAARVPHLHRLPYHEQHAVVDGDHFVWAMPYHQSMGALGYEVLNVDRGIRTLQHAWARESGLDPRRMGADEIVVRQARAFRPDVLLFEGSSLPLLKRIRDEVPSVRLVLTWAGSALTIGRTWGMVDVVLTCAPESVARLATLGATARHVNHAFDPALHALLGPREVSIPISFIGSIVPRGEFHLTRERMLRTMCQVVPLSIYSPNATVRPVDYAKAAAAGLAAAALGGLRRTGLLHHLLSAAVVGRVERIASPFRRPVHPELARRLQPGVYGLEYFTVLRRSGVSLNIHADTSRTHASNLRLYEAAGAGSCLLTDWKVNLADLYEPDAEVAAYRSVEEATEKATWLLEHPRERETMALAGMRRTLAAHTFAHRATQMDGIIREWLRRA